MLQKPFYSVHLFMSSCTPQNIHLHLNHLTCYIAGFLHQFSGFLQYVLEAGTFYLIKSEPLKRMLQCNKCHMERLGHKTF